MQKTRHMMAWVNWCKKCKAEVPQGESCPYCGAKLTKTGERLSLGSERVPVRDWFAWNAILRVIVPVLGLVLLLTVVLEAILEGAAGVQAVFVQGFFGTLLAALGIILLVVLALLLLQGRESVHDVLDAHGVHQYVYLRQPSAVQLYARLLTPTAVAAIDAGEQAIDGLTLIRATHLTWADVKRVRFWLETNTILFYRPKYWQAMAVRCSPDEYEAAEMLARKKLARNRKALPKSK